MGERYPNNILFCLLYTFPDGFRYFPSLTQSASNAAIPITHYNNCTEAEPTSTFHNLGDSVEMHYLVYHLAFVDFRLSQGESSFIKIRVRFPERHR